MIDAEYLSEFVALGVIIAGLGLIALGIWFDRSMTITDRTGHDVDV